MHSINGILKAPISSILLTLMSSAKNTAPFGIKKHAVACHIRRFGDHRSHSPAGAFLAQFTSRALSPLFSVEESDFNSYGSRRGNHHVMVRGTFANEDRNKMADGKEGGWTRIMPSGELMTIFDASQEYQKEKIPLIVFAGTDYGMGSSRDWAAKGPALMGVKVVVAKSLERIRRSNLIGMGILPLQFKGNESRKFGNQGDNHFLYQELRMSFSLSKKSP